jgi:hypothetical protein
MKFTNPSQVNHGYDDERGDYHMVMHDHIAYRYEIIDTLGKVSPFLFCHATLIQAAL